MNSIKKLALLDSFDKAYTPIFSLLDSIHTEVFHFIPPIDDAWSINSHLVHLLDADISVSFRMRAAIAEPGKTICDWAEEKWCRALSYDFTDGLAALSIAQNLRLFASQPIRKLVDCSWQEYAIVHPEKGYMPIDTLLASYTHHATFHLDYIKRNLSFWS